MCAAQQLCQTAGALPEGAAGATLDVALGAAATDGSGAGDGSGGGADPAVFRSPGATAGTGTVAADSTGNAGTAPIAVLAQERVQAAGQGPADARGPLAITGTPVWWPLGVGLMLLLLGGASRWRTR
jgi:hypothetical protein